MSFWRGDLLFFALLVVAIGVVGRIDRDAAEVTAQIVAEVEDRRYENFLRPARPNECDRRGLQYIADRTDDAPFWRLECVGVNLEGRYRGSLP